jgi:triacylglycerol lipase
MTTSKIQAFTLAACAAAALLCAAGTAHAQFQKGPDPTASALERNGPFAIRSTSVSSSVSGFGGGQLYYPTASGTYGAIAVSPGYTGTSSTMTFWGERLASHGFVVIVIDTNTLFDQPDSRARQLKAALDYLATQNGRSSSPIYRKVDTSRLAVAGHSMGGGGTLLAARDNPSYKAAIPMAPWNLSSTAFRTVSVPTMIFGCQDDTIAPVSSHAIPFYNAIPSSTRKNYVEIRNDDHFCVMNGGGHDATLGKLGISWMKRFVDNDTRYSPFVCGAEYNRVVSSFEVSRSYNNCPY